MNYVTTHQRIFHVTFMQQVIFGNINIQKLLVLNFITYFNTLMRYKTLK